MKPDAFAQALDDERIVAAIQAAESRTRAEIRVHLTDRVVEDAHAAGARTFEKLGMTRTAERNGVLLFVAPESQTFAVLGDRGIHERCGDEFWSAVAGVMREEFKAGRFTEGILAGIAKVADELVRHFPRSAGDGDVNELPDTVSRDQGP
jgi:uncharacterized membrane protein